MLQDGPKRQGRFLKKGSKVLGNVMLQDFVFKEIEESTAISHDNAGRTIIHSKYHDVRDIDHSVKFPETFNEDLMPSSQRRPVIFPMDFTKDWERDKKLRKDRVARADEEDLDFDFAASMQAQEEEAERQQAAPAASQTPNATTSASQPPEQRGDAAVERLDRNELPRYQSMDIVGKAIKSLMPTDDSEGDHPESAPQRAPAPARADPAFIPVNAPAASAGPSAADLEAQAMEQYKRQVEEQKAHEARMAKELEESKAQGFRDGFRIGEEKAELQVRGTAAEMFGKVAELIKEFQNLKHEVLNNVQENFYEICQAVAEALLKREFTIRPEAFVTVLRRAISDTVDQGSFKIKVHPDMFDRIATLGDKDIVAALVKDAEMEPTDFRIESTMSVVDVNARKLIGELLQQADLGLFDGDQTKPGKSGKKAG